MRRKILPTLALLALTLSAAHELEAAITTTRIATGLRRPVRVVSPPGDARIFVVEQGGFITVLNPDGTPIGTFLDIDALVPDISGSDERGLLGLAFSPEYATDGLFYVNYTDLQSNTVVARYQVSGDPNLADASSAEILLAIDQPFNNHNGGHMAFGPDGFLYLGMGDGGSFNDPGNRAQDDTTLLGKMLRIDVVGGPGSGYSVPPDNPNVGGPGLNEIWAKGLRNPWAFGFDAATGDLYIADVGQDRWEEVNVQPAASEGGENYGWRLMEGAHCFIPPDACNDGSLTPPIHEYAHGGGPFRCSITGGVVYRGFLTAIEGHYFFADWCSDEIWSLVWDRAGGILELTDWTDAFTPDAGTITNISAFGLDDFGHLFILDRGTTASDGELFRVVDETLDVGEEAAVSPAALRPAPNPFSRATRFTLAVPDGEPVAISVLDAQGRLVRELPRGHGSSSVTWDGTGARGEPVSPGVYLIRVDAGGQIRRSRVTVVR